MKKLILLLSVLLSTAAYSDIETLKVPNFTIRLEAASPEVDLSKSLVSVREICGKHRILQPQALIYERPYSKFRKISDTEYEVEAGKVKCSAFTKSNVFLQIAVDGKILYKFRYNSKDTDALARDFEKPILIEKTNKYNIICFNYGLTPEQEARLENPSLSCNYKD